MVCCVSRRSVGMKLDRFLKESLLSAVVIRLCVVLSVVALAGCDSSPEIHPVTGKVNFPGGEMPQAEIARVAFEPVAEGVKAASGDIKPDGTFQLMTVDPGDGAFAGDYKVALTVHKTYLGRQSLIDKKYTSSTTTPLVATVKAGEKNHFEFTVDGSSPK
jgi:hypothetical protein